LKNGRNFVAVFIMLLPIGKKNDSVGKTYLTGRKFHAFLNYDE